MVTNGPSSRPEPRPVHLCGEPLPQPGHVCAFFDSASQKYDTLLPFIKEAIDVGDDVFTIVDADAYAGHVAKLSGAAIPVGDATDRGQLTISTAEETYLSAESDSLARLIEFLERRLQDAKRDGRCVRTWGEMNWIARSDLPINEILEYEARVNDLLPDHQCSLVCVYDTARIPSAIMSDILATHPYAIVKGRLRKNPFYVPPVEYLSMLKDRNDSASAPRIREA